MWITMCITSGDNSASAVRRSLLAIFWPARILLTAAGQVTRRPLIHRTNHVYHRPRQQVPWGTTAVTTRSLKARCLEAVLQRDVCGGAVTSASDTVRWKCDGAKDSRPSDVPTTARHFMSRSQFQLQLQPQLWQRKRGGGIDRCTAGAGEGQRSVRTYDDQGTRRWARVDRGTGR